MIIFPAVDIKGGRAVRLRRGRADEVTVFAEDPVEAALGWQEQGAEWLHLVDLDGAFEGLPANRDLAARICHSLRIPVQLGGGIRTADQARSYLEAGVARLIIGTMALEEPELFAGLCREFPGRIGVSLDTENGRLKSRGWVADAGLNLEEAIPDLEKAGAAFIIHTDISRDGMGSGVNLEALARVCQLATVPVIAAGGVATLGDIEAVYPLAREGRLAGVISGRALYEGSLKLPEARAWLAAMH